MGFGAESDKGMSGRYSARGTVYLGVELGIRTEGTPLKWRRNQKMHTEFLASGKCFEGC